jgi:hypothetical protein
MFILRPDAHTSLKTFGGAYTIEQYRKLGKIVLLKDGLKLGVPQPKRRRKEKAKAKHIHNLYKRKEIYKRAARLTAIRLPSKLPVR